MLVAEGDRVAHGQPLFVDKNNPDVPFVAPGSGTVTAVNRGERRILQSVVVKLDGNEDADTIETGDTKTALLKSGLWTSFRTRPFSKIPAPDDRPASIFITAIDTNPLAADPAVVIATDPDAFRRGLEAVAELSDGAVHVCTAPDADIAVPSETPFEQHSFGGPHPAGLVGTHIHLIEPVSEQKTVWHIGYQDVMAIGRLMTSGRVDTRRIVAFGGPCVSKPRLIETRAGANLAELTAGEYDSGPVRIVSGSVLSGHRAAGWASWLGRYHNQVAVLSEGAPREFLHWLRPGIGRYSSTRAYIGNLFRGNFFPLSTSQNGSARAMVSIGSFEQVMPLDILPTPLLKALIVRDTENAKALGALELDEEDLALCSFVCNGKYEYGPHLRSTLHEIEVNG